MSSKGSVILFVIATIEIKSRTKIRSKHLLYENIIITNYLNTRNFVSKIDNDSLGIYTDVYRICISKYGVVRVSFSWGGGGICTTMEANIIIYFSTYMRIYRWHKENLMLPTCNTLFLHKLLYSENTFISNNSKSPQPERVIS